MENGRRRNIAYVNGAIIAVNVVYFLYLELAGSTDDLNFMVEHGAMFAPYVVEYKEYYRLFTSIFMHFGIDHILNNMVILFVLGDNLERALGKVKYLLFYIVCGVGANIISMQFNISQYRLVVSAGASGAIFGVIGGLLYAVVINRGQLEDLSTRQLVMVIGCSLYFGFIGGGVDNAAHISGLILGILMSMILYRKPRSDRDYEI
ncbi:MAG: rhomboid family intramembrane serine protease [Clostridiaceae bacterium]|nr:rhomboid family intramembrane serine protease [Clostridiaceae bacterium]